MEAGKKRKIAAPARKRKIPLARDKTSKECVLPEAADTKHDHECLDCGHLVVLKQASDRCIAHFAHQKHQAGCQPSEKTMHLTGYQLIARHLQSIHFVQQCHTCLTELRRWVGSDLQFKPPVIQAFIPFLVSFEPFVESGSTRTLFFSLELVLKILTGGTAPFELTTCFASSDRFCTSCAHSGNGKKVREGPE